MARTSTGSVVSKQTAHGVSCAIRFRAGGKRQYVHVGYEPAVRRPDAEKALAYELERVRRGEWQPPAEHEPIREVPTFHQAASAWFEAKRTEGGRRGTGLSPAGETDLRWQLEVHLLPAFARKRLDAISVEDVDRYRRAKVAEADPRRAAIASGKPLRDDDGRLLRPLGTGSINKTLSTLSAILEQGAGVRPRRAQRRRWEAPSPANGQAAPDLPGLGRAYRRCLTRPESSTVSARTAHSRSDVRCWRR